MLNYCVEEGEPGNEASSCVSYLLIVIISPQTASFEEADFVRYRLGK